MGMKKTAIGLAVATAVAAGGVTTTTTTAKAAPWLAPVIAGAAIGGTVAAHGPYAHRYGYGAYAYAPVPDEYAPGQVTNMVPHGAAFQPNMEHDAYAASSS